MKKKMSFLSVIVAILTLVSCTTKTNESKKTMPLKDAYKDAFLIGCAVNEEVSSGKDTVSQRIILEQFNSITP